jgi:hypothetical protein
LLNHLVPRVSGAPAATKGHFEPSSVQLKANNLGTIPVNLYRNQISFLANRGWPVGFPLVCPTRFLVSLLVKNFVSFRYESNRKWGKQHGKYYTIHLQAIIVSLHRSNFNLMR